MTQPTTDPVSKVHFEDLSRDDLDRANSQAYTKKFEKGLSEKLIRKISKDKNEPAWLLKIRLKALKKFYEMSLPDWGPDLKSLDFDNIRYFASATNITPPGGAKTWDDVDPEIKRTFERLRIPQAERAVLAGVGAQYE